MSLAHMHGKLLRSFLPVVLGSLLLLLVYLFQIQRDFAAHEIVAHLESMARLVVADIEDVLDHTDQAVLQKRLTRAGAEAGVRITVVDSSGRVLIDSEREPSELENHGTREEILAALAGRTGHAKRYSRSVGRDLVYVAVPLRQADGVRAVVRTSAPERNLAELIKPLQRKIMLAALVLLLLAALVSYALARQLSRPLVHMTDVAERFANGDLNVRANADDTKETAALARSLNRMAANLEREMKNLSLLLDEQRAVFNGMEEGLLVIDDRERVAEMNPAAERLLNVNAVASRDRSLLEIVRNSVLQGLVTRAVTAKLSGEGDIVLYGEVERHVRVRATPVARSQSGAPGALVVLADITRLKKLEEMRRDFVANASHELKTPVTSIKGFSETLLGGDLPEGDTRRFVEIIARQADQLASLIDDLLDLTRIEYTNERGDLELEQCPLVHVIEDAVRFCEDEAKLKDIEVSVSCPESLEAKVEPQLLLRAVANLVENAVKYSEAGKKVFVEARSDKSNAWITVRDEGPGIASEHLPRIFERFYRVDKARSRKLGGTGLGLAIVKHVIQAHRGDVAVESRIGHGSTFTLRLPLQ